jgi:hypothetical protein
MLTKTLEFWKIIIPTIIAVLGWATLHILSKRKDLHHRRKEIITNYLIEAYRNIENGCGRNEMISEEHKRKMEQAIADIQLFGSPKQIDKAKEFTERMNKNAQGDPRSLLAILRNDLRNELGLERASDDPSDIHHWRLL